MSSIQHDHTDSEIDADFLTWLDYAWQEHSRPWPDPHKRLMKWHTDPLAEYRRIYNSFKPPRKVTQYHAIRCLRILATSVVTVPSTDA